MTLNLQNFFKKQINIIIRDREIFFFQSIFCHLSRNQPSRDKFKLIHWKNSEKANEIFNEIKKATNSFFVLNFPLSQEKEFFPRLLNFRSKIKIILNSEVSTKKIFENLPFETFTFGREKNSDFWIGFLNFDHGMSFKLEFFGKVLPIFVGGAFGSKILHATVANLVLAYFFNWNLIEIANKLRSLDFFPGRMRLIKGINESFIFDNSDSREEEEFLEAIEIFLHLRSFRRKFLIAGKKEKLFFVSYFKVEEFQKQFLMLKGEALKNFELDEKKETLSELIQTLKKLLGKNDLVLINGFESKKMKETVDEIRKIW